jgi:hypothetical protein
VCTFKYELKTNKRADSFAGVKVTKGKGKIVPLHPMKVYRGHRSVAPPILNGGRKMKSHKA